MGPEYPMQLDECTLQLLRQGTRCRNEKNKRTMGNMGAMGAMPTMGMKEILQQLRQEVFAAMRGDTQNMGGLASS